MRRWALILFLGTMVAGCEHNKTTMAYSPDAWRIVPIVRPGETIEWLNVPTIEWFNGDSPCVPDKTPCEIRKDLTGVVYGYGCQGMCDPEIAVDDPGGILKGAPPAPPPTHVIHITCVSGTTKIEDTEVHTNETIGWGAYNSGVQKGWKVMIDKQADLCNETTGPIQTQMICTVKAQPTTTFEYSVSDACASQQTTRPLIKVIPR